MPGRAGSRKFLYGDVRESMCHGQAKMERCVTLVVARGQSWNIRCVLDHGRADRRYVQLQE
jgi:hypothetical protein